MASAGLRPVAIVGVGLIGGSLAAGLKRAATPRASSASTRSCSLELARSRDHRRGLATRGDAARAWLGDDGVDLVVLATPARFVEDWLRTLASGAYRGVVTDVASTKSGVLAAVRDVLPDPSRFVGGHPMAGSELSGVSAAKADLFDGAYWLLTPSADTDPEAYRRCTRW